LIIGVIAIVGNLATIGIVAVKDQLRKPYFLTILTLAVADLMSVIFRIGTIFLEFELPLYLNCIKPSFYVLASCWIAVEINSMLQIVLIAVIKFLLLICPMKSRTCVTINLIVVLFFVLLLVSASITFSGNYVIMQKVKADEDTTGVVLAMMVVVI
jgi:hypothetical protein